MKRFSLLGAGLHLFDKLLLSPVILLQMCIMFFFAHVRFRYISKVTEKFAKDVLSCFSYFVLCEVFHSFISFYFSNKNLKIIFFQFFFLIFFCQSNILF